MKLPRITVVTPSYNQGQFIDDTLRSVLGQEYPELEYFVMDGGSTDESLDVIRRHAPRLTYWTSGPDGGQAAAINAAFARSKGDILCWLNSDDMYLPGCLHAVANSLDPEQSEILFGNCVPLAAGRTASLSNDVYSDHRRCRLELTDYIIQPSSFWTRRAWETVGPLDASLNYSFDWDWFIRAERAGVSFKPTERHLAVYRFHKAHKTGSGGEARHAELTQIYLRYAGLHYSDCYAALVSRRKEISRLARWVHRFRLSRYEFLFLKIFFPKLCLRLTLSELRDIVSMT